MVASLRALGAICQTSVRGPARVLADRGAFAEPKRIAEDCGARFCVRNEPRFGCSQGHLGIGSPWPAHGKRV